MVALSASALNGTQCLGPKCPRAGSLALGVLIEAAALCTRARNPRWIPTPTPTPAGFAGDRGWGSHPRFAGDRGSTPIPGSNGGFRALLCTGTLTAFAHGCQWPHTLWHTQRRGHARLAQVVGAQQQQPPLASLLARLGFKYPAGGTGVPGNKITTLRSKESGNGEAEGQLPKSVHRSLQRHVAVACAHSSVRNSAASAVAPARWYAGERQWRTALGSSGVVLPAVMSVKSLLSSTQVRLVLLVLAAECTAATIVGHAPSACSTELA